MKKSIGFLALAVLGLSLGARTSRADEPVLTSDRAPVEMSAASTTYSDNTLAPDAITAHEIKAVERLNSTGFNGHDGWFRRIHRGSATTSRTTQVVPEPSTLPLLLCGCLGLIALSRKLANAKA